MNILLQTPFINPQDFTSVIITISLLIAFILILIVGGRATNNAGSKKRSKKKYSKWVFYRIASNTGLNKKQIKFLEQLVRSFKLKQPFLIFTNPKLLDELLKRTSYNIQNNQNISFEDKEKKTNYLFQIKQTIDRKTKQRLGISSTHLIRTGQSVLFMFPDNTKAGSSVVQNYKKMITCTLPANANQKLWKKGSKLKAHFWRENDSGYTFITKILGFGKTEESKTFFIQHSTALKRNQQRKTKRKTLDRKCFFYPIEILTFGKGKRAKKKAIVQYNLRHIGTIIDVCAGGCSINTQYSLERGQYLKMEFRVDPHEEISVYGRVRRVSNEETHNKMHIVFTKISNHNKNKIYSFIYNYTG